MTGDVTCHINHLTNVLTVDVGQHTTEVVVSLEVLLDLIQAQCTVNGWTMNTRQTP